MAREGVTITIGARIQDAINGLGKVGQAIGKFAAKWAALAGVAGVAASAFMAVSTAINEAMDMEQALASLETLTGSLEVAQDKMKELVAFAQRTPLDLKGVQDASRLLLATGTGVDDLMGRLEMLGDIASGAKQPINELGLVFSQVMNKGRLMAQDLNQFSERGVPLLTELASIYKVTAREILTMGENGRISSEMVLYALKKMTSEGGRFYQAMAKQNETFAGKLNSLKETWLERLRDFGTPIITALKPVLVQITQFLARSKDAFVAAGNAIGGVLTKLAGWVSAAFTRWPDFVNEAKIFGMEMSITVFKFLQGVNAAMISLVKGAATFVSYIKTALQLLMAIAKDWEKIWDGIWSGKGKEALAGILDGFVSGLKNANEAIANNPIIKAFEDFNKALTGNLTLLEKTVQELVGKPPERPQMWGSSSMKKEGAKLGPPPSLLAPNQVFTDKEIAELERQAKGLGQMSGTAATARKALRRAQRAQEQFQRGNIEEANRAAQKARESADLSTSQEARRKLRADTEARNQAGKLRQGKGGFTSRVPESQFDPKTGRLKERETQGASAKMPEKPARSEEAGFLASIEKILDKRLPAQTA